MTACARQCERSRRRERRRAAAFRARAGSRRPARRADTDREYARAPTRASRSARNAHAGVDDASPSLPAAPASRTLRCRARCRAGAPCRPACRSSTTTRALPDGTSGAQMEIAGAIDTGMENSTSTVAARSRAVGLSRHVRSTAARANCGVRGRGSRARCAGFADVLDAGGAGHPMRCRSSGGPPSGIASESVLRTRLLSRLAAELRYVDRARGSAPRGSAAGGSRVGRCLSPRTDPGRLDLRPFQPDDPEGRVALNEEVSGRAAQAILNRTAGHAPLTGLSNSAISYADRALAEVRSGLHVPLARWFAAAAR
jgi:hypothetical protein